MRGNGARVPRDIPNFFVVKNVFGAPVPRCPDEKSHVWGTWGTSGCLVPRTYIVDWGTWGTMGHMVSRLWRHSCSLPLPLMCPDMPRRAPTCPDLIFVFITLPGHRGAHVPRYKKPGMRCPVVPRCAPYVPYRSQPLCFFWPVWCFPGSPEPQRAPACPTTNFRNQKHLGGTTGNSGASVPRYMRRHGVPRCETKSVPGRIGAPRCACTA